ncbi:DDE-type integrase/transposase/recombinase [Chloroflexota bacterium]
MRTPVEQIGASLNMFYDCVSIASIIHHLDTVYNNPVNRSNIHRWIKRYTEKATQILEPLKPTVSDTWVVVETVIKIGGNKYWFWGVIDERTHFLLSSYLSQTRSIQDVMDVVNMAKQRAGKIPNRIISDRLGVYPDGIERVFGADAQHIQTREFTEDINTPMMKQFHDTIKQRHKAICSFKMIDTAKLIQTGLRIHYNFFRLHTSLTNRTPAKVAQITTPVRNWTEVVSNLLPKIGPNKILEIG